MTTILDAVMIPHLIATMSDQGSASPSLSLGACVIGNHPAGVVSEGWHKTQSDQRVSNFHPALHEARFSRRGFRRHTMHSNHMWLAMRYIVNTCNNALPHRRLLYCVQPSNASD
ncbi:hypothetical protein Micbo1qcDRAFT_69633 [Microdochium bolleyi]|uniref:Uncharacterized protein n=1 Tax=Microdochium bolleyi TaxID=196109 RepID=A0A136J219_9PEZI|nr:hypothetical protein Micbo1qcDRAFT_69633 [Microdochium bolleyi]